jgi:hypothetical protein
MRQQNDVRSWLDRRRRREGIEWLDKPPADSGKAEEDDRDGERHDESYCASAHETANAWRALRTPRRDRFCLRIAL